MLHIVDVAQAEKLIVDPDVRVIDVRTAEEFAAGHLPRAEHCPLATVLENPAALAGGKRVLFVCAQGGRSKTAAEALAPIASADVYSLTGGTFAWIRAGLPHETSSAEQEAQAASEDLTELDALVGENLRELRAARGYTLDILAGLSGVGRQALGQIELGRTVPNPGTLWKIARAFDVPFSVLLARKGQKATQVLRQSQAKRLVSVDGRFSSRALFPFGEAPGGQKVEFYELWLAAHGREDAEAHAPGTRENLVVVRGALTLEIGSEKERHELGRGDAIVFAADVPHAYINATNEECWMNLVMTYGQ
jgi:rhodanese-related sulfurtransferase/transcriptional regulator with XRE-family HTH domain